MKGHIIRTAVIFAFLQITACCGSIIRQDENQIELEFPEPRVLIVAKMTLKIEILRMNITKLALTETSRLNTFNQEIKSQISAAKNSLKQEIDVLDEQVKNASAKAKQDGMNIFPCIIKERKDKFKNIRPGKLSRCNKSYRVLASEVASITSLSMSTGTIIPRCETRHPFSNKKFKKCILDKINDTNNKIEAVSKKIHQKEKDLLNEAKKCIQNNIGNIDLEIEKISEEFKDCVDGRS